MDKTIFGLYSLLITKKHLVLALSLAMVFFIASCGSNDTNWYYGTVVAPPAKTLAAEGGSIAQTQAAKLLQAAQVQIATQSARLKETAKVEAATAAAELIDTAQARLVTQSAGKVTAAPTDAANFKNTAEALLKTQVVGRAPAVQTEAAILAATAEARLVTGENAALEQESGSGSYPQDLATATLAALLNSSDRAAVDTQSAWQRLTPFQTQTSPGGIPIIAVYLVREGDTLQSIADQFGIRIEKIIYLNQYRFPWLAGSPQTLAPGMMLIMAAFPGNNWPVNPSGQVAWSDVPGCDVSQVDWLQPPIHCKMVQIDVVNQISQTIGCISLQNPFGYRLNHETISGWMLNGADGVYSYGWFADQNRGAVIIGPALITSTSAYSECRSPDR